MKNLFVCLLMLFGVCVHAQVEAPANMLIQKSNLESTTFEIGLGYIPQHAEGFGIPKLTFSGNNVFKNLIGVGFYISPEYRPNIQFQEDGTNYYFRLPIGINYEFGAMGIFLGGDPISLAAGKNLRKEIGISLADPSNRIPIALRVGYSNWVGFSYSLGYRIPLND
jgi:hypothetical protein